MGQYHTLINLDKKEKVEPHDLGLGLKQWEHLGEFNGTLADAMYVLCMTSPAAGGGDLPELTISGRWAGDRVVIYGDYTSEEHRVGRVNLDEFTDIGEEVAEQLGTVFGFRMEGTGWKHRVSTEVTV